MFIHGMLWNQFNVLGQELERQNEVESLEPGPVPPWVPMALISDTNERGQHSLCTDCVRGVALSTSCVRPHWLFTASL